jgi:hypothetical protein
LVTSVVTVAGCPEKNTKTGVEPTKQAGPTQVVEMPSDLDTIVQHLAPCNPWGDTFGLEHRSWTADAHASCETMGFPERLPASASERAGPIAPGAVVTIVHPEGATPVVVRELGCRAYEDHEYLADLVLLDFTSPTPLPVPWPEPPLDNRPPRFLAVLGNVHPDARLRQPIAIDFASPEGRIVKNAVERAIPMADALGRCVDTGEPSTTVEATVNRRVASAHAWWVDARPHRLVFVQLECPSDDDDDDQFAMLLDPAAEDPSIPVIDTLRDTQRVMSSNAGIGLDWLVDLDGDGTDELIVDVRWLEDGGESLRLLYWSEDVWTEVNLWTAMTP